MLGIEWARASQFNWTFDNCGGTPLQEIVCGLWSGITFTVQGNQIIIPEAVGGGKVYYFRGVWKTDALFAWGGFWVDPEAGDINYLTGGFFQNIGNETLVTLGRGLPNGTEVQAYYVYNTGEKTVKYEALNSVPCMRRAFRSASDYTYDFAVDRIFDAMAAVYFAYKEQGLDPTDILKFFWNTYLPNAVSNGTPLILDDFNRQWFDKGSYLLYADSTFKTSGFEQFGPQIPPSDATSGRALRFKPSYYHGTSFSAWFGYGFNWDLTKTYFEDISKVKFKLMGSGVVSRVQKFIKTGGTGTANMVLIDGFNLATVKYYQITVNKTGAPGTAEAELKVMGPNLVVESTETILCPTSSRPVQLGHGLQAYWEDGTLAFGDTWLITCGNQEKNPHRLMVSLNNSIPTDPDPFGETHTFVHGIPDAYTSWQDFEIDFSQFWRLGNIIDCRDRKAGFWGNWSEHNFQVGTPWEMLFYDVNEPEAINGEVFYTKQRFTWNLDPSTTVSLGFYVGIPADVNSTGRTTINYLLKHYLATDTTFRTKVRDINGNYFYHEDIIAPNSWVRVSINLSSFLPESGGTLTHPLTLVDISVVGGPAPPQGSFELCDLKFDDHLTYTGSDNLRVVEFKYQETPIKLASGPDWYLDDFGVDLSVEDPYPYVPRLAISLNAYGRNPWRGPTLVHYSHPLAPFLVNRFDIKNTELALHLDAQAEYTKRYGGLPGPIVPVHTRNDIENIQLCGEENFNRFCWWSTYRDHGNLLGSWRFNGVLTDSSGNENTLVWGGGGSPAYTTGLCQPGNTALIFDGAHYLSLSASSELNMGESDFVLEAVVRRGETGRSFKERILSKRVTVGYELIIAENDAIALVISDSSGLTVLYPSSPLTITDTTDYHYIAVSVDRDGLITFCLDGAISTALSARPGSLDNTANFTLGRYATSYYFKGQIDYVAVYRGVAFTGRELTARNRILRGLENGSDYPEVGYCLGQFWAFYRLGEYFFVSNDLAAWEMLDKWLDWFDACLVSDGSGGYKFPIWFSEYGYAYDVNSEFSFDAGGAASVVIGALYIYMRNGDSRALGLAQKLLSDLRTNRTSGEYGGYLYKSDYHYAWMNALVAHAFGMALVGRAGQAYRYPYEPADEIHYQKMMENFWLMSGDTKPNLLNADLIPYHDAEPHDIWDYAPHYLFMKEMGSMEGVVLMMHAAIDWALYNGSWYWFNTLLEFMIRLSGATLTERQIYSINSNYLMSNLATTINLTYGDYQRQKNLFVEAKDNGLIALVGEKRQVIPLHYGMPVITEDHHTAQKIAQRALAYFSTPKETLTVLADLAAARLELNDVTKIQSRFHGFEAETFALTKRVLHLRKLRVGLELQRAVNYAPSWAVDTSGGAYDSYAIDVNSEMDGNWLCRAYGN